MPGAIPGAFPVCAYQVGASSPPSTEVRWRRGSEAAQLASCSWGLNQPCLRPSSRLRGISPLPVTRSLSPQPRRGGVMTILTPTLQKSTTRLRKLGGHLLERALLASTDEASGCGTVTENYNSVLVTFCPLAPNSTPHSTPPCPTPAPYLPCQSSSRPVAAEGNLQKWGWGRARQAGSPSARGMGVCTPLWGKSASVSALCANVCVSTALFARTGVCAPVRVHARVCLSGCSVAPGRACVSVHAGVSRLSDSENRSFISPTSRHLPGNADHRGPSAPRGPSPMGWARTEIWARFSPCHQSCPAWCHPAGPTSKSQHASLGVAGRPAGAQSGGWHGFCCCDPMRV